MFLQASRDDVSDEAMSELRRGKDTFTTVGTLITWALDAKSAFA